MSFSFHCLYYFSNSSPNSLLFNLFWLEKNKKITKGTQKGTQCSRTGLMWAIGKRYKDEKSWDCHSVTSWPLFTAINYISKATVFCMTLYCLIFSLFFYYYCVCLCFTDSSYSLQFDNGLTKHVSLLHVQAEDPILLSTQPDQSS